MKKFYNITTKSFDELQVNNVQELWNKVKGEYKGLSCELPVAFKKAEDGKTYTMTFSTSDEDRHGDVVEQEWDLKWFKKNPVLIDSHNYDSITHIIGKVLNIGADKALSGEIEFATMNPKGALAQAMVDGGFLNASSVGFIPKEFDDKGRILKSELLEISMVSVPANPRALLEKIVDETEKELEVMKNSITDDTEIETIIETKIDIDKKKFTLNQIAKALEEINKENIEQKRRHIFKALRKL